MPWTKCISALQRGQRSVIRESVRPGADGAAAASGHNACMRASLATLGIVALVVVAGGARAAVVDGGYPYASACPGAGIAKRVDRWRMYECNCTSYVAWALEANGQRVDWFVPGAMDARNWPRVAAQHHIRVGRTPRVGAVAVWPHLSRFGHVAYVTAVQDGRFGVAEYNLPVLGTESFAFDVRTGLTAHGAVFIYVPRARPQRRATARTLASVRPPSRPPIR